MFYTYVSLTVFLASVVLSWVGYTLLSVQLLIWWVMQLTCILTITCISQYVHLYGARHGLEDARISKSWFYKLLYTVALPVMGCYVSAGDRDASVRAEAAESLIWT